MDKNISTYYDGKYNKYVGARYVPVFTGEWNSENKYEPLSVVLHNGNSYISKTFVPVGVNIDNNTYWVLFSNYNAQLAEILENIENIEDSINEINDILASLSDEITKTMFTPLQKRYEQYKNNIRRIIVNYMARNNFSTCVNGDIISDGDIKPLWQYNNQAKGLYGNLINPQYTFNKASLLKQYKMETGTTTQISDVDYTNMYCDCVTLTYMLCSGIDYLNSPYYYGNNVEEPDIETLIKLSQGNQDLNYFYALDFKGQILTDHMALNLEGSGNTLQYVGEQSFGSDVVYYDNIIDKMQTGDIVFLGSQNRENDAFYGIHHCGVFIKSINELNTFGVAYNQTYKTFDGKSSTRGYIIDCDASTSSDNTYTNVIKIQTLESWLERFPPSESNRWQAVYVAKPFPNALNCNKYGMNGNFQQWGNAKYFTNFSSAELRRVALDTLNGCINTGSVGVTGIGITEDFDYNELKTPGVYYPSNNNINRTNAPNSYKNWQFHLIIVMGGLNVAPIGGDDYKVQVCIPAGGGTGPICYRTFYKNWSNWIKLEGVVDA